ncbi:MAG: hypothetical protein AAF806_31920 [Bacteroidota bacterium]
MIIRHLFLISLFSLSSFLLSAQSDNSLPIHQENIFLGIGEDSFNVAYIDILNEQQLNTLPKLLEADNYPLTVLHRGVFSTGVEMMLEYDLLAYQYEELEKSCDTLTVLHEKEMQSLRSLIDLEKERADIIKQSRDELMVQMQLMNQQLTSAVAVENKSRKRTFGKNVLQTALGAAVGFATGVLLIEFAKE